MNAVEKPLRPNWLNILTVVSAAILIGAETVGLSFAAAWAFTTLFHLDDIVSTGLYIVFGFIGLAAIGVFLRSARRIEPFFTRS